jgi:hypothetical protein
MTDHVNTLIACAESAMKGREQCLAAAAAASAQGKHERAAEWMLWADEDERRAKFYLARANDAIELRNQQIEEAA